MQYAIQVNDKIYGPFSTPAAAVRWAIKQLPMAPWCLIPLRDPEV